MRGRGSSPTTGTVLARCWIIIESRFSDTEVMAANVTGRFRFRFLRRALSAIVILVYMRQICMEILDLFLRLCPSYDRAYARMCEILLLVPELSHSIR